MLNYLIELLKDKNKVNCFLQDNVLYVFITNTPVYSFIIPGNFIKFFFLLFILFVVYKIVINLEAWSFLKDVYIYFLKKKKNLLNSTFFFILFFFSIFFYSLLFILSDSYFFYFINNNFNLIFKILV
jgi:hypothetical protein